MSLALFQTVSSQSYLFDKRGIGWNQTIQENNPEHKSRGTQQCVCVGVCVQVRARLQRSKALAESPSEGPLKVASLVPAPVQ